MAYKQKPHYPLVGQAAPTHCYLKERAARFRAAPTFSPLAQCKTEVEGRRYRLFAAEWHTVKPARHGCLRVQNFIHQQLRVLGHYLVRCAAIGYAQFGLVCWKRRLVHN